MIEYRLIRSDRRTLSIGIDGEGALVVRAPMRMSTADIEGFLNQKQRWIREKQAQVQRAAARVPALEAGAVVPFWGGELKIAFGNASKAVCENGVLWLPACGDTAGHARKWRLQQAQRLVTPCVAYWAERTGLHPSRIAYGHAATRWGSMNHQTRSLRLNAALVHCPQYVVEYVIVHELAHLLHPDHSAAFHAAVRRFLPDADERRQALKQYACLLRLWK